VIYRDRDLGFCGSPASTFNVSNALRVTW
jgi:hypothetical protein